MAMVQCPYCRNQVSEEDNVCMYCGNKLKYQRRFCGKCGAPLESGAAFCTNCGKPVGGTGTVAEQLPGAVVVSAGGEQAVRRQIMHNTEPQQQAAQQMADYKDQTETAQQAMDRQPTRQQAEQAADYQHQAQNARQAMEQPDQTARQAADYRQQVQNAHEVMDQPKQQTAQQAADYQQQVQNAHEAMNPSGQQTAQQASEYQHMSDIGKEAAGQEAGKHISRSATAGARRAAKLGVETGKIAAKGATRSVGNMIGLKIAAIATAATVATGGATAGGVALVQHITESNSESNTAIVEEYEDSASATAAGPAIEEEPVAEAEPVIEEIDPALLEPELGDFLWSFHIFYISNDSNTRYEYDAEDPDLGIFRSVVRDGAPCVNFALYPGGSEGWVVHDFEPDPRGWFTDSLGYSEYNGQQVNWILEHIFHVPQERIEQFAREAEAEGDFYRTGEGRNLTYYTGFKPSDLGMENEIRVDSVKTDGEKYYVIYSHWYVPFDEPSQSTFLDRCYTVLAREEIDGKYYWTMYYHSSDVPKEFGLTLSEGELYDVMQQNGPIAIWCCEDFSGDGKKEAFAVIRRAEASAKNIIDQVCYIDSFGEVTQLAQDSDLIGLDYRTDSEEYSIEYDGYRFFTFDFGVYATGFRTALFGVKDNRPYELELSGELFGFYYEDNVLYTIEHDYSAGYHQFPRRELLFDSETLEFYRGERLD